MLSLDDFDYHLPKTAIAQQQVVPRDSAKLMVINRQTGEISHHHCYDLPSILPKNITIVVNNTKVFPARLKGKKKTGGKVEILLTSALGNSSFRCLTRPGLDLGDVVYFTNNLLGTITEAKPNTDFERTILFNQAESHLRTTLSAIGEMPTPPYIKKLLSDQATYQTIYAKHGFSAAAPTAGLHFTPQLTQTLQKTHHWQEITLDIGLGTFLPVKEKDITKHQMHKERFTIEAKVASSLNKDKTRGQKILAVGTTTLRTLESSVKNGLLIPNSQETGIYIYPPYKFQFVDALMTNFHLPKSTLLMLVAAFVSYPNTPQHFTNFHDSLLGKAYEIAIAKKYRFFSFGDAMLIL